MDQFFRYINMESKNNFTLLEETRMPFGKHKGKMMKELPDDYIYYLYSEVNCYGHVKQYVDENIDAVIKNLNKGRFYNKFEK